MLPPVIRPSYPILNFFREVGIGKSKGYEEIKAGRLKVFKIGRKTMVAGEDGMAWLNSYRRRGSDRAA